MTHLDRIYWPAGAGCARPATTKRDYLRYLGQMAPVVLAHVLDRPLTPFRWPEDLAHRRVLEKHREMTLPPFVERVRVFSESKGRTGQYILQASILERWSVERRAGRVFPDTNTNGRGKSITVPYSPRGLPGARCRCRSRGMRCAARRRPTSAHRLCPRSFARAETRGPDGSRASRT